MNPFRKFQYYFIGSALAKSNDAFEKVKAEVLFNFTFFFLLTNIPYLFVAAKSVLLLSMGISVLVALALVLIILKKTGNVKQATYFFLGNFAIQCLGHYFINNGKMEIQGTLFFLLYVSCGFLLLDRKWGWTIALAMIIFFIAGVYNCNSNFSLFHVPSDFSDPAEAGPLKYFALIPAVLNYYLVSEFVKARQKAERQISEQKQIVEEKQKEILDSIHYAKRIQNVLMPNEKHIARWLEKLNKA